ncbi:unnamed protein product (macronuclear) [Paramecium tetraurelia]|uniref:Transmembrane protein n=1 Tax=Paramecium tetraurelia TaxID=5888 RepID=A0D5L2_PARTE|nr:uncharacterized protein GSPATT00013759001 [Paramecium tetraurelia]CAK78329.1 unnamed protein product [Paramecium tetraurelia]|eukprot:XP_001445726.1 hypothetical protein (macronuclear) [Paramecium tetraurelia strain d4-2]
MNFICLFISVWFCFICQEVAKVQFSDEQYLYFLENERHYIEENMLGIHFENDEDLKQKFFNYSSQKLIEKYQEFDLGLDDNAKTFKFFSHQGKYIDICFLQHSSIDCRIRINNTLYNEGLIVNQINSSYISLPSNSCYNAFYIEDEAFLINCLNPNNQIEYILLNQQSEIQDQITVNQPLSCNLDSKFKSNKLLINSLNCSVSIFLIIEIDQLEGRLQFNKNFTNVHEQETFPTHSMLIDIKLCEQDQIILIFSTFICTYNLENQSLNIIESSYQPWFLYIQDSCFPYKMNGQLHLSSSEIQLYPFLNSKINLESQIKCIYQAERNFIFLYEGWAEVSFETIFGEKILNIKQICKLNTLPFLMTLDQNNKIQFYRVLFLTKGIKYQGLPFFGLSYKTSLRHSSIKLFSYYSINQYSIIYPMKIELIGDLYITNDKISRNTLIINYIKLSKSIPLYLDLESNQEDVFQDFRNYTIYTHHKDLPIKKILKIISLEINFIAIIYEDKFGKIYVHLKNNEIEQNKLIMSKNSDVQVEFIYEIIDQITIFIICKHQIMQFQIVAKNDIVLLDTSRSQLDIQECKVDQKKLICLLDDYTVYAYQYQNWYKYFSETTMHLQEFLKQQQNKYNDFRIPLLYIDHKTCTIKIMPLKPYQHFVLIKANGQILLSHIFVPYQRILLILQKDNLISLELYYFCTNEILHLYQMPLYQFTIIFPIEIKFLYKLFSIITQKDEKEYLFTYDITQQAKSCLQSITKMYDYYENFNLIDGTGITSQILPDQIIINYPYYSIKLKQTKKTDYSTINFDVQFQANSFIYSIPSNFSIHLNLINSENSLRFKIDAQQQILKVNNQYEITNLDSIYGSVNNLHLGSNCKGFLSSPIQLIKRVELDHCIDIYQQFCLVSNSMIIVDYISQNQTLKFLNGVEALNKIIKFSDNLLIVYNSIDQQIHLFSASGNKLIQKDINNKFEYIHLDSNHFNPNEMVINIVNNFVTLETVNFYSIYLINRESENHQMNLLCNTDYQAVQQTELLYKVDSSFIFLILTLDSLLKFEYCPRSENENAEQKKFGFNHQIVSFYILNSTYENQQIHLILILFNPKDIAYTFEFSFDLKESKIIKSLMRSQIIRYLNVNYQNFIKINDTNFILKGKQENSILSAYFYKINISSPIQIIDYYYKDEEFSDIDYYNETHFVLIKNNENSKTAQLIQIHNYQVHLENNCELVLHNDVSSLISPVFLTHIIQNESQTTIYLLMGNFLLILLICNKYQNIIKNRRI